MALHYRFATVADSRLLAELNHQLIRDEGHRNPMNVDQLEHRMRGWLSSVEYRAIIFAQEDTPVAYAFYTRRPGRNLSASILRGPRPAPAWHWTHRHAVSAVRHLAQHQTPHRLSLGAECQRRRFLACGWVQGLCTHA